ncbi:MAG TPA: thiamine-phosphate kinase [Casimicrobiaceae bacterium]|nr:thiamine-phosphate kinase [Casimicrobiaceae bacterium]
MTEFELIERYFRRPARNAVLGVGDDAALIAPSPGFEIAASVDMLVEGRHFFPGAEAEALGYKTLAVNLSDLAAMGATPRWALLACALPSVDEAWLAAFARGFFALAEEHAVDLVGGDTTGGPRNLCVTVLGEVPAGKALRRSGAKGGDSIWVSGRLGDAALAVAHRLGRIRLEGAELAECESALARPAPRVALGLALRGIASAVIDVSDGLVGDLGHVLDASRIGATIDLDGLPRSTALERRLGSVDREVALQCLLAGGDDYELCFTAPRARDARITALGDKLGLPLTRIGIATAQHAGLQVLDANGRALEPLPRAFDHFAP